MKGFRDAKIHSRTPVWWTLIVCFFFGEHHQLLEYHHSWENLWNFWLRTGESQLPSSHCQFSMHLAIRPGVKNRCCVCETCPQVMDSEMQPHYYFPNLAYCWSSAMHHWCLFCQSIATWKQHCCMRSFRDRHHCDICGWLLWLSMRFDISWVLCILSVYYGDVIMGEIAYQITSLTIVSSAVYSEAEQRKHQSSVSLAVVRGIDRGPVYSPQKWPVTRKMFPFDDGIMFCSE